MSKFKLTIFIGRKSPFHNGHAEVLQRARLKSDAVLVLLGSINQARNPKNPWSFKERSDVITKWSVRTGIQTDKKLCPVNVLGIRDYPYNDQLWIANVHRVVDSYIKELKLLQSDVEICITGADRDSSTFYLKYFPNWKSDIVDENLEVSRFLTATAVREIYFGRSFNGNEITADHAELLMKAFLPSETIDALREFEKTDFYDNLRAEHLGNVAYRKAVEPRKPETFGPKDPGVKYETIFQTVDAIVVQTGHILLVKRKAHPGKGLWALPGGFVNPKERLVDAMIRELNEETRIKVPDAVLRSSIVFKDDLDFPERSLRGRTISKCFLIKLPDFVVDGKITLPKVKGQDDAEKAWWVPINEIMQNPEMFFEDHWFAIESFLGKLSS